VTSTHSGTRRVWLTPGAHRRLRDELADLFAIDTAEAGGHDRDEGDAGGRPARSRRRERVREIRELLARAVVGEDPPDDGMAEPGMVLTVHYGDADDTETFLLGMRAVEHGDIEVYSPASPLGSALLGARRGEQRTYRVPDGSTVQVTLVDAVPYGRHPTAGGT
jgi:transcription elongation GreA/GreB family factor